MTKKKPYDRKCVSCSRNQAVWAMQHFGVPGHPQVRTRPSLCDECANPVRWSKVNRIIIFVHRFDECLRLLNAVKKHKIGTHDPIILLANNNARLLAKQSKMELLSDKILIQAGQSLYKSEYASEYEERDGRYPPGTNIDDFFADAPDHKILKVMRQYEVLLCDAWGESPLKIFTQMGIESKDWYRALYYTLMACVGHGIGLEDDFSLNIDVYETSQEKMLDTSPLRLELMEFREIAYEHLDRTTNLKVKPETVV